MVSRLRMQYCKVVIATSLVWFLVDVFLLMYFTDCTMSSQPCDSMRQDREVQHIGSTTLRHPGTGAGFFDKLIPNARGFIPVEHLAENEDEGILTRDITTVQPPAHTYDARSIVNLDFLTDNGTNATTDERKKYLRHDDDNADEKGHDTQSRKDLKPAQQRAPHPFVNVLKPRAPQGPGELGKPVVIPDSQQAEMKEKFKINQFNLMASDLISVNRSLADVRMDACKRKSYPTELLPTTSVVIVFHNEAWSTLLRTIHSVLNRSPSHLLEEIILVDDASERDFLGKKLDDYVATLSPPVYVERMGKRSGLIRARLRGAGRAKGKVITFLDAHCECTEGWLEPLLFEIYKDRKSVVCPIIDVISDDTFEYITGSDMTWGGFNWKLNFRWYPVPQREMERRGGDRSLPLRSPTMAGGLFAMDREYFYELGSYDHGMDIWGGENLEMSFRIWMCSGTLLIVTCSHVGHVFRKATPYTFPGGTGKIINHNNARLAEVWMDDWRDFYYKINPGVRQTDYGDVTERKQLRERLQCKSFRWYLENIYPESQMPLDYYSLGEIRNKESGQCLDSMGRKAGEKVGMVGCHGMGGNQIFSYTKKRSFQTDDLCLDVSAMGGPVKLYQCHGLGGNQLWEFEHQVFAYTKKKAIMIDDACIDLVARRGPIKMVRCHGLGGNQMWEYDGKSQTIRHVNSNQCLDKPSPTERDVPSISVCNGSPSQQWMLSDLDWKKMES